MKRVLYITIIAMLTFMMPAEAKYVLVIDAGHGGHDAGAIGSYSYEKNINLATALAFGRYVEGNCPDVKVIYTRKTDVFIPLHQRADIANKNHADVFISIHTNSLPPGRIARGLETYTMGMRRSDEKLSAAKRENNVITFEKDYKQQYAGYDPNSPESSIMFEFMNDRNMAKSVELAKLVQKNVCATAGRPDKGVKQDVFLVLRETAMPACLIELGWISTPDEETLLNDKGYIDSIARGIYQAFVKYKGSGQVNVKAHEVASQVQDSRSNVQEVQTVKQETKKQVLRQAEQPNTDAKPVFKVQILSYPKALRQTDERFKGETPDSYVDGNMHKYTIGASTDYNEILKLKRQLTEKFPDAFVIAFKNGERMDINQARQEYKKNK